VIWRPNAGFAASFPSLFEDIPAISLPWPSSFPCPPDFSTFLFQRRELFPKRVQPLLLELPLPPILPPPFAGYLVNYEYFPEHALLINPHELFFPFPLPSFAFIFLSYLSKGSFRFSPEETIFSLLMN